jgi:hypothetical protein
MNSIQFSGYSQLFLFSRSQCDLAGSTPAAIPESTPPGATPALAQEQTIQIQGDFLYLLQKLPFFRLI